MNKKKKFSYNEFVKIFSQFLQSLNNLLAYIGKLICSKKK